MRHCYRNKVKKRFPFFVIEVKMRISSNEKKERKKQQQENVDDKTFRFRQCRRKQNLQILGKSNLIDEK